MEEYNYLINFSSLLLKQKFRSEDRSALLRIHAFILIFILIWRTKFASAFSRFRLWRMRNNALHGAIAK